MNRDQVLKKMRSINNLPTLPIIALEVNRLLQDFDSPLEQLVDLLSKDQSLVLKILRLVNSSFYGFKSKVKSVGHAVTLLGYNTVRNAVITVTVIDTLALKKELPEFKIEAFWKHAIQVAVLSRYLGVKTRLALPEDAFTAGLLHDIGKVVLADFFPAELIAILRAAGQDGLAFYDAELKLCSCPHNLIGAYLAQQWMLPETLNQAIQYHHSASEQASRSSLVVVVNTANNLAHMMNGEKGYQLQLDRKPEVIRAVIAEALKSGVNWYSEVKKEVDAVWSFLNKG
ncbi:MAG: HDOD domain-containing protein [Desulfobacteraceae bacterium]|nr:MAG: HDOD domain-containing protein [Desulfobacteraceae bacterium]